MVKLEKVNKYFNRHKRNQIHVIKDTSIEFENNGLIAILGSSGSGKTTLLNCIGGLDKINKGKIYINEKKITKVRAGKIDKIRNLKIGYIFQNYNLIDNYTVFQNIALALKMIGIKNKAEVEKRVNYVMNAVGIYKYRNRPAYMLSGGERQRVGIARAIVKNPEIIIADEPTGNLDSKNSLEIMNIIKSISKDKLVILVTHEKDLAKFYASRIIKIVDGKIVSDEKNENANNLDYRMYNQIFLKDMPTKENIEQGNLNINYFSDTKEKIKVNLIVKNGNIYVESNNKVEVVDDNSGIELIDAHYEKISKEIYEKYKFDYEQIIDKKHKPKHKSIYNCFTMLAEGFKKIANYSIIRKILLLGFVASSMFTLFAISNIYGVTDIKDEKFVKRNSNYIEAITAKINLEDYLRYEEEPSINYIIPGDSLVRFCVRYYDYYQTSNSFFETEASLAGTNMLKQENIILGKMPEDTYEVVLDKNLVQKMLENEAAKQVGIKNVEEYLGRKIDFLGINNIFGGNENSSALQKFTVVGIVDLKSPSIYAKNEMLLNIIANSKEGNSMIMQPVQENSSNTKVIDVELVKDKIELKKGRMPENDYEVIVNISNSNQMKLNKKIDNEVNGNKLKIVGYYFSNYGVNEYYTNLDTVKYSLIEKSSNFVVYPNDITQATSYLEENKIDVENIYEKDKNVYISTIKESLKTSLILAGVILVISLVEIFLIMRSSFLSRIKEIGILRAIGVKKADIYKMFLGEILAISIITQTVGTIFMTYILKEIMNISYLADRFMLNNNIILIGIGIVLAFNVVIGLLPVIKTLRKTPAQILSSNNVD